jgi:hypothetical protein
MGQIVTFTHRPLELPTPSAQDHNSLVVQPTPWSLYPVPRKWLNVNRVQKIFMTLFLYCTVRLILSARCLKVSHFLLLGLQNVMLQQRIYRGNKGKKKVKVTLVQALRLCTGPTAHWRSIGIALLFHDHGTRRGWEVSVTPRQLFTPGKTRYPLYRRLGDPTTGLDRCGKSRPHRDSIPGPSSP